jgi:hypothetical protein
VKGEVEYDAYATSSLCHAVKRSYEGPYCILLRTCWCYVGDEHVQSPGSTSVVSGDHGDNVTSIMHARAFFHARSSFTYLRCNGVALVLFKTASRPSYFTEEFIK